MLNTFYFQNKHWPDSIKNDFVAHVHKFMATLVDAKYKLQGKTVLYVPQEGLGLSVEQSAKNKEYCQRLESEYMFSFQKENTCILRH